MMMEMRKELKTLKKNMEEINALRAEDTRMRQKLDNNVTIPIMRD